VDRQSEASAAVPVGLDAELRRALGVTETDLATNRGGHISPGQHRGLVRSAFLWALVAVACVALAILIVITIGTDSAKGTQSYWPVLLVLAAAAWSAFNAFREFDEVSHGELKSWRGSLTCEREPKRLWTKYGPGLTYDFDYAVNGGKQRWQIPYRLYRVFENGLDYRVFYGGKSGALLSIEALGTPDPNAQHHHRSTAVLDTPATVLLSCVAIPLTSLFLLLSIAWGYTPLIVVSLATLGVIVLSLAHVVPFVLGFALVGGALFFALLVSSLEFTTGSTSPNRLNCLVAKNTLPAYLSGNGHWEFRPPDGSLGRGAQFTQPFTVGDDWTISWTSARGVIDVEVYTPGGFGRVPDQKSNGDHLLPSGGTRDFHQAGEFCVTVDAGFDESKISAGGLSTDWRVTIDDHR
jgi:hypothetical protein